MPHDANGIQDGRASGSRGGGTAGHNDDGGLVKPHGLTQPAGQDGAMPAYERGVPPHKAGIPQGYQGGFWPQGGHGTTQTGTWEPAASAPRGIGKCLTCGCHLPDDDHDDPRHITMADLQAAATAARLPPGMAAANIADEVRAITADKNILRDVLADVGPRVMAQLEENFPARALEWVKDARWAGPLLVPLNRVDFHDEEQWAAWHETGRVDHFRRLIRDRERFHPVVMIKVPGHSHYRVVDGHHRALAFKREGRPVQAWIGVIPFGLEHAALETHSSQEHQGDSKENE